jgi:hypothetical protein
MKKHRSWSKMPLNNKIFDNLFHLRIKPKYYPKILMHTENNASPFLLRKKVKMSETNAAAHKKQHESLSPDNKSQFLNKDAGAHKKP